MKDYLYIFVHVPRTAGTTFLRHIEKNVPEDERIRLYIDTLKYAREGRPVFNFRDYEKIVEDYIKKVSFQKDLNKIKILYGHIIPYGVHKYFKKTPRYFTFLRDPVKRTVSLYNFWNTSFHLASKYEKKNSALYKYAFLVKDKVPSFEVWVDDKVKNNNWTTHAMLLTRFFSTLGYMKSKGDTKSLIKTLNNFYFVGKTQHFENDSLFLYYKLKFNKFFYNQSVSKKYFKIDLNSEVGKALVRKLSSDVKIVKLADKIRTNKIAQIADYFSIVRKMKLKRAIFRPATSLMYDTKSSLRYFKNVSIK